MITLTCPSCQVKLKVNDDLAGKKVRCPNCKQTTDIPNGTVAFEPAKPSVAEDATVPRRPASFNEDATVPPKPLAPAETVLHLQAERNGDADDEEPRESLKAEANYEVAGEIARGGMGAIMRAVDQDIHREVAVKFLLNHADDKMKARFVEEAQITGQLEHPNIVPIHQLGVHEDGRCFFSMKMVKGQSLAQILKDEKSKYTLGRLLNIFVSICNAMAYAHSREVIHRDLKPANVMVGDFGEVYVMDWGLAKVLGKEEPPVSSAPFTQIKRKKSSADTTQPGRPPDAKSSDKVTTNRQTVGELTQAGAVMGTPAYMPPEQATGQDVDQRADIYSLGAILYEIMTLTPPVGRGGDIMAILMRVVDGKIDPPMMRSPERAKAGWIPSELSAITMKALALKPEDRYQTVEALRRDVELLLEGRSVSAKQDSFREMFWKLVKRNKAASVAASIAFVALLLGMLALIGGMVGTSFALARARADQKRAELAEVQAEGESTKAKDAYQAYLDQVKGSVPLLLRAAKTALGERQFDHALMQASIAAKSAPDNAEARLLKGQLLITRLRFAEAAAELEEYRKLKGEDAGVQKLAELCGKTDPKDADSLMAIAEAFTRRGEHALADGVLSGEGKTAVEVRKGIEEAKQRIQEARQRVLEIYRKRIEAAWPGQGNKLTMNKEGQYSLQKLEKVTDLTPLRGMLLTTLVLPSNDQLRDLEPLKGMPLTSLNLNNCKEVRDLEPLKGMPLTTLSLIRTQIKDLEPLKGMKLTLLSLYACSSVRDLEPLKGMPLTSLDLNTTQVHDLEPLKGMPLTSLNLHHCKEVRDLEPLKGMPLTTLSLIGTQIKDLEPLKGMPLTSLNLLYCKGVRDLEPLKDMPLRTLVISGASVTDLTPLQGMELEDIRLTPKNISQGMDILRDMESLKTIGTNMNQSWSAAEFWSRYEKGEFKK